MATKNAAQPHQGKLVLEIIRREDGYHIWPVTEEAGGADWPVLRREMDRETSRRAIGHDPAESDPNSAVAHATAESIATMARERYGWRYVEIRVGR